VMSYVTVSEGHRYPLVLLYNSKHTIYGIWKCGDW
jgi:hypothetical protein